jgi:phospholipase C
MAVTAVGIVAVGAATFGALSAGGQSPAPSDTTTPIKHLVVIFNENSTFDHYFATYPHALNPPGEPSFNALPGTPTVNGLTGALLTDNPNEYNPQRLDRSVEVTCDQDHHYSAEQEAYDGGLMDQFVQFTAGGGGGSSALVGGGGGCGDPSLGAPSGYSNSTVMDYYDGNTVTALWNYAQHFTLADNSFETQFGPSTPGHLNLISGDTGGAQSTAPLPNNLVNGSIINNANPRYDDCASGTTAWMTGRNVGNLLNDKDVTWGWFQGGFTPSGQSASGGIQCNTAHDNIAGASIADYLPFHEPFQYYQSTANPDHLPPTDVAAVGHQDQANHQYDMSYFFSALDSGDLPAVSFLKPPAYEDAHPAYSDPLDEQRFLVQTINAIEQSPDWASTAIVISYDDSDGWYDHVMPPIVRPSASSFDALNGPGKCGNVPNPPPANFENDRCGYGPRLPMLVISPWARPNFVDNTLTDQSSILRFIEDNWQLGRVGGGSSDVDAGTLMSAFDFDSADPRAPAVILDPSTGEVAGDGTSPAATTTSSSPPASSSPSTSTTTTRTSTSTHHVAAVPPLRARCRARRAGRSTVSVTCVFSGRRPTGRVAVRLRLVHGAKVLSTGRTLLRGSGATMRLAVPRSAHGRFTVRIAVSSASGLRALAAAVTIPRAAR